MSVTLIVLGVLVAMAVAAYVAAAPLTYQGRRRGISRRRHWVATHPESAKAHDVVDLLRRSGMLMREARGLTDAAAERGIRSVTMFRWLHRLDDDVRVTLLRAGLSDAHLLDHVGQGTLPDLPGVREFAQAHGLALAPTEDRRSGTGERRALETPAAEDRPDKATGTGATPIEGRPDRERRAAVVVQPARAVTQPSVAEPPAAALTATRTAASASASLQGSGLGSHTPTL